MKRLLGVLAVCLILGLSGHAFAGTAAGDNTVVGSVAYSNINSDLEVDHVDVSVWSVTGQLAVGRFVTDQIQLEVAAEGMWGGMEDGSIYMVGLTLRPNFHFATQSATVPYIGAAVGGLFYDFVEESDTIFVYGAQVGLKQFIRENAFLQMEGRWRRFEIESEDIDLFQIFVGFGLKI